MSEDDRARWDAQHAASAAGPGPPAPFVLDHVARLPPGRALDLACGRGRHARVLAERGHRVVAVDLSAAALESPALDDDRILRVRMDLDAPGLRDAVFDAIVVVSFLDRRLFPRFAPWLRPGGILLYETFLTAQASIGHPRNPDYLLAPNELVERLGSRFRILHLREGRERRGGSDAFVAGVVAERVD